MTSKPTPIIASLNAALEAAIGTSFDGILDEEVDVLEQLLADKRSENTRRAYKGDIENFFQTLTGKPPHRDLVLEFLHLEQRQAVVLVLKYKAKLIEKGLSEATLNRRLAAIKSMVAMGRKLGLCSYTLEDIKGERVQTYRDTRGISPEEFKQIITQCDLTTLKGKRDYALLRLLWDNALRRGEVAKLNIKDFDSSRRKLRILGKGKGKNDETIDLSQTTVKAIGEWLLHRKNAQPDDPLFVSVDYNACGNRLTGEGIRWIVDKLSTQAGVTKKMSPHRIRHSSITAALDATKGDVRKVQKLSRHKQIETLMIYDDNRLQEQGEISDLLADLI